MSSVSPEAPISLTMADWEAVEDPMASGEERPLRPSAYVAAFLITGAGLYAARLSLGDSSGWLWLLVLTLAGFITSYQWQHRSPALKALEAAPVIGAAFICVATMTGEPPAFLSGLGLPFTNDRFQTLALCLVYLAVLRSYFLVSPAALMFCCVPTLATMGLVGTVNGDPFLVLSFVVFLSGAVYLMIHLAQARHGMLRASRGADGGGIRLLPQVLVAMACVLLAVVLGIFASNPLEDIGASTLGGLGLYVPSRQNTSPSPSPSATLSEPDRIQVATGPVGASDQVVLRVTAKEGLYWRGATFDTYTGHGWETTVQSFDRPLWPHEEGAGAAPEAGEAGAYAPRYVFDLMRTPLMGRAPNRRRVIQRFRFSGAVTDIYAAGEPSKLMLPFGYARMDDAGNIKLGSQRTVNAYTVESEVVDAPPAALRKADTTIPSPIASLYLQLPDRESDAMRHVREAALKATAAATNNYDRVVALEQFIGRTCTYNLNAQAVPTTEDVAEYFLFTEREGYCDSFATTLAVLCRSVGIPARVASGFLPGEPVSSIGEFVVRDRDRHQWTEVYFDGYGWVTFDATSFAREVKGTSARTGGAKHSIVGMIFSRGWLPPLGVLVFLALLVYVVKTEILDRRSATRRRQELLHLPQLNREVIDLYGQACQSLAAVGLGRAASVTPMEHARALAEKLPASDPIGRAIGALSALVIRFRYGVESASQTDVAAAREHLTAVREGSRAHRRSRRPGAAEG